MRARLLSVVLASTLAGCGGDDGSSTPEQDAASDSVSSTDGGVRSDTAGEVGTSDTGSGEDTSTTIDSALADSTSVDSALPDSALVDSTSMDSTAADTTVSDVADTSLADTATSDTAVDAVSDTATGPSLIVEREDETPKAGTTIGTRGRLRVKWNAPGATKVELGGAPGALVAVQGTPRWDELGSTVSGFTEVTTTSALNGVMKFTLPAGWNLPIAGDTWKNTLYVSKRGVVSRYSSSTSVGSATLPVQTVGVTDTNWADGTIAPFLDTRLEIQSGSAVRYGYYSTGDDARAVVEWRDLTVDPEGGSGALPLHLTFQAALYKDGRVELRYKRIQVDGASSFPVAQAALGTGGGAAFGLANAAGTRVMPLSVRRAFLPTGDGSSTLATWTIFDAASLPPSGEGIVVAPKSPGAWTLSLKDGPTTLASKDLTVADMYTVTEGTGTLRDISAVSGVKDLAVGTSSWVPYELPFAVNVSGEAWRALAVTRDGRVAPYGQTGTFKSSSLEKVPSFATPNGFLALAWIAGPTWSGTWYGLAEGTAPNRTVTILMKDAKRVGGTDTLSAEAVLHEDGDVELIYSPTGSSTDVTGGNLLVGLENGNGDVGRELLHNVAGTIVAGKKYTLTRVK